jgi:hypothetical protein
METTKIILISLMGIAAMALCVFYFFFSLKKNASRFLKYFLIYSIFIAVIGLLFYLFPHAVVVVTALAVLGWMALIVIGSKNDIRLQDSDDREG